MVFINLLGPPTHRQYYYFIIPFKGDFSTTSLSGIIIYFIWVWFPFSRDPLLYHILYIYISLVLTEIINTGSFSLSQKHYRMLIMNCVRHVTVSHSPSITKHKYSPME
jgi:hypothetical protein